MKSAILLLLIQCLLSFSCFAQQGTLDSTFSNDGKLILSPSNSHDNATALLVLSDQTILFTGTSTTQSTTGFDIIVGRLHSDGTLDSTFGTNGYVIYDHAGYSDYGYDIDLTSEDKIVVTGAVSTTASKVDMFCMRLNPNGSYDTTFGGNGRVVIAIGGSEDYANKAVILPNDQIVLGGTSIIFPDNRATLVRLNTDGSLDSTFGTNGISLPITSTTNELFQGLILKPNGSFIAVGLVGIGASNVYGHTWGILPDGSLDTTFGNNGDLPIPGSAYLKNIVARNNQYYICGYSWTTPQIGYIANISDSGTFNPSFGLSGIVRDTLNYAVAYNDIKLQSDGKIIAVGADAIAQFSNDLMVTRFATNGALDTTFGTGGRVIIDLLNFNNESMLGVDLQADGKIVSCGVIMQNNNDMAFIRLDTSTAIPTSVINLNQQEPGFIIYPNPSNGNFTISFSSPEKYQRVNILNTLGEIIFTTPISNESQKEINLNISSGIYFVEGIKENGMSMIKRVAVQ
jgi:uncharacterized delta-60 repeat protein